MKRLNKITLILVAVMGIMISGCGSSDKFTPYIQIANGNNMIVIVLPNAETPDEEAEKMLETYKKLKVKKIALLGKKECPLQDISQKRDDGSIVYGYQVKNRADCPPKDRLKVSYEITLKTNYGIFNYNTGDNSTAVTIDTSENWNRRSREIVYKPINTNGGKK